MCCYLCMCFVFVLFSVVAIGVFPVLLVSVPGEVSDLPGVKPRVFESATCVLFIVFKPKKVAMGGVFMMIYM